MGSYFNTVVKTYSGANKQKKGGGGGHSSGFANNNAARVKSWLDTVLY